jgi:hypothetical protein
MDVTSRIASWFSLQSETGWQLKYNVIRNQRKLWGSKNAVFWDVTPCGSCKNRRFGGTYLMVERALGTSNHKVVIANVPSSPIPSAWWWRWYFPMCHRLLQDPHSVTSQKTEFLIILSQQPILCHYDIFRIRKNTHCSGLYS